MIIKIRERESMILEGRKELLRAERRPFWGLFVRGERKIKPRRKKKRVPL